MKGRQKGKENDDIAIKCKNAIQLFLSLNNEITFERSGVFCSAFDTIRIALSTALIVVVIDNWLDYDCPPKRTIGEEQYHAIAIPFHNSIKIPHQNKNNSIRCPQFPDNNNPL